MMLTFNFIIDKFCLIRSKYKKRFTLTCCFCNLKSWAGLRPGCIPYIQVTWSVLTNQRPVFTCVLSVQQPLWRGVYSGSLIMIVDDWIIITVMIIVIITSNTASSREVVTPSTLSLQRKLRADLSLLSPGVSPATIEHGLIFDNSYIHELVNPNVGLDDFYCN